MGLKANLSLFKQCAEYAKAYGKEHILQTLPQDLSKIDTCGLTLAKKIDGDVLVTAKEVKTVLADSSAVTNPVAKAKTLAPKTVEQAPKHSKKLTRAEQDKNAIETFLSYQSRADELGVKIENDLKSQGVPMELGENLANWSNFSPDTGFPIKYDFKSIAEYRELQKHIQIMDTSGLIFDADKLEFDYLQHAMPHFKKCLLKLKKIQRAILQETDRITHLEEMCYKKTAQNQSIGVEMDVDARLWDRYRKLIANHKSKLENLGYPIYEPNHLQKISRLTNCIEEIEQRMNRYSELQKAMAMKKTKLKVNPAGKKIKTVEKQEVKLKKQIEARCRQLLKEYKIDINNEEETASRLSNMSKEGLQTRGMVYTHKPRINRTTVAKLKAIPMDAENTEIAQNVTNIFLEKAGIPSSLIKVENAPFEVSADAAFAPAFGKIYIQHKIPKEYLQQGIAHETDHAIKYIRLAKTLGLDKFKKYLFEQNRSTIAVSLRKRGIRINEKVLKEYFEEDFNTEFWTKVIETPMKVEKYSQQQVAALTKQYATPSYKGDSYKQITAFINYYTHPLEKSAYTIQEDVANALGQINAGGCCYRACPRIKNLLLQLEKFQGKENARTTVNNICKTYSIVSFDNPFELIKLADALEVAVKII